MTTRPRTGIGALARLIDNTRQRLEKLENAAANSARSSVTVPLSGAQFNPILMANLIGTVAPIIPPSAGGVTSVTPDPVTWSKVTSDYDVTFAGPRIQLPHDGHWSLDFLITPTYPRISHRVPTAFIYVALLPDATFSGFRGPTPAALTASVPGAPAGTAQIVGYGNSVSLAVAAIAAFDDAPGVVYPTSVTVDLDIHRLIEG